MSSYGLLGVSFVVLSFLAITPWYLGAIGFFLVGIASVAEFQFCKDMSIIAYSMAYEIVIEEIEEE